MVKQDCIAVKFCEKTEKRLNFHKVKKKKKEKFRVVSTIIARSEQMYLAASGRFSHSGSHIIEFFFSFLGGVKILMYGQRSECFWISH